MHTPMSIRSTLLVAALATVVATAYGLHQSYLSAASIGALPVPARYFEAAPTDDR